MNTYFIDGLRETEEDGIFSVDDDEAEFWTVYRRDHDGFGMAMFDLCIKEEAEKLVQVLEERDALLLENAAMREALDSIRIYSSDTLSGPSDFVPDMAAWLREGVEHLHQVSTIETPATSAALAAIQAQGVEDAVTQILSVDTIASTAVISHLLRTYAAELREAK